MPLEISFYSLQYELKITDCLFCKTFIDPMSKTFNKDRRAKREELHQHNYNYYILDEPSISDLNST